MIHSGDTGMHCQELLWGRGTVQGGVYGQKLFVVIKHSSLLGKFIIKALLAAT